MPRVAVSYRRADSAAMAGRIFDHLTAHYGEDSVFMDIDNIPFGVDFRGHIREVLFRTDVLIAVIGGNWLGGNAADAPRMQEEKDPVRVEIETALERKTQILPVLIDGAKMPESKELPSTFGDFAYLNALEISSGRDFRTHMERLIVAIDRMATLNAAPVPFKSAPRVVTATREPLGLMGRDAVRYFLVPLIVLLATHYAVVNILNLNTGYLRLACVLVPLAAGFALFWIDERGAGPAAALALMLAVAGAAGMTASESVYAGDPILPQTRFEWLDNLQFAGMIALSFMAGHVAARFVRRVDYRMLGKSWSGEKKEFKKKV